MNSKGSKRKGKVFEQLMAEVIGSWWVKDEHGFMKAPGSGSHSTLAPWMKHHVGDVVPAKPSVKLFPFAVECKNTQDWQFDSLWTRKGKLWDFIRQAKDQAKGQSAYWPKMQLHPLLLFTRNRGNHYAWMEFDTYRFLGKPLSSALVGDVGVILLFGELISRFTSQEVIQALRDHNRGRHR